MKMMIKSRWKNKGVSMSINLLKIEDFAKLIKTPPSTVRTWIRRGDIPATVYKKIGATIFILTDKFKTWVDRGAVSDIPE